MLKSVSKCFCLTLFLWLVVLTGSLLAVTRQQYVDGLVSKANHYSQQEGKSFLAINYINEAVKLQPRNLNIYSKRAFIYGRLNLYTEAIKDLTFILRNDTGRRKFPSSWKYRAECYSAIGAYARAIADYKRMINNRTNKKSGKIWYYYAELLWFMGNKDEALKAVSIGLKTGSHWVGKIKTLENKILLGKRVKLHRPFSN